MIKITRVILMLLMWEVCFANDELNPIGIYCLSYTWLGPDYSAPAIDPDPDAEVVEMKCEDYLTIGNSTNTPCVDPIIFSEDTLSMPDPNELWQANMSAVACRKSAIQSCATYTVSFNGLITYRTHLCTRVRTKTENIRSGCFIEKRNNMDVEVCVCESEKGLNLPCNSDATYSVTASLIMPGLLIYLITNNFLLNY